MVNIAKAGLPEIFTNVGPGDVPTVTGLAALDKAMGAFHTIEFTFTDMAVALADEAGVVAYKGTKIFDFPEGVVHILGMTLNLALTKSSAGVNADWDGDVGVGSVTASNNATLATTEQNIVPTTPTPQAVSGATTADAASTAAVTLDGTATPVDVYLNLLVDDADHDVTGTACNLIVNGTAKMHYVFLGNH